MRVLVAWSLAAVLVSAACPAVAQSPPKESRDRTAGAATQFASDIGHDYARFISWENVDWLAIGAGAAFAVHPADNSVRTHVEGGGVATYPGADLYGRQVFQMPLAIGWWIAGASVGSVRGAATGRDLVRAQISAASWTYVMKLATDRTRPNGDPRSLPSGHAANVFATATVLQQHYGWKAGVPAYAAAIYTAASRVAADEHWLSDVAFGAAVGLVAGRTVTLHVRASRIAIAPVPIAGGIALTATPLRRTS
jgi:membrane-associated phospholipid phosphatase